MSKAQINNQRLSRRINARLHYSNKKFTRIVILVLSFFIRFNSHLGHTIELTINSKGSKCMFLQCINKTVAFKYIKD